MQPKWDYILPYKKKIRLIYLNKDKVTFKLFGAEGELEWEEGKTKAIL